MRSKKKNAFYTVPIAIWTSAQKTEPVMQIKRYLSVCWSRYTVLYENKSRTYTAAYAPAVIGSVFFTKIQIIVGTVYTLH